MYVYGMRRFILFHSKQHLRETGTTGIEEVLTPLALRKRISGSLEYVSSYQEITAHMLIWQWRRKVVCPWAREKLWQRPLLKNIRELKIILKEVGYFQRSGKNSYANWLYPRHQKRVTFLVKIVAKAISPPP